MPRQPITNGAADDASAPFQIVVRVGGKLQLDIRASREAAKQAMINFFSDAALPPAAARAERVSNAVRVMRMTKQTGRKPLKPKPAPRLKFKTKLPFQKWDEDAVAKAAVTAGSAESLAAQFPGRTGVAMYNKLRDLVRKGKLGDTDAKRFRGLLKL